MKSSRCVSCMLFQSEFVVGVMVLRFKNLLILLLLQFHYY